MQTRSTLKIFLHFIILSSWWFQASPYDSIISTIKDDGGLIVATAMNNTIAIVHITKEGKPDPAFPLKNTDYNNTPKAMRFDADNNLVLVNYDYKDDGLYNIYILEIKRYKEDGTIDLSFGTKGTTKIEIKEPGLFVTGIEFYPNKKFVVATDSLLLQYTVDGKLDTSFATTGMLDVVNYKDTEFSIKAIALDPNNHIVVASGKYNVQQTTINKYNATGNKLKDELILDGDITKMYSNEQGNIFAADTNLDADTLKIEKISPLGAIDTTFTNNPIEISPPHIVHIASIQGADNKPYLGVLTNHTIVLYDQTTGALLKKITEGIELNATALSTKNTVGFFATRKDDELKIVAFTVNPAKKDNPIVVTNTTTIDQQGKLIVDQQQSVVPSDNLVKNLNDLAQSLNQLAEQLQNTPAPTGLQDGK